MMEAQSRKARKGTGDVFGYVVFRHHQFGSEFLEGEYTRIEQDAQEGNEPESRIADYGHHILEGEFFIIAAGGVDRDLAVELAVHESEAQERNQSADEQDGTDEQRSIEVPVLGYGDGYCVCHLRADAGQGDLYAHGQSHFLAVKPFGDDFCHRYAGHFGTDTEYGISGRGHEDIQFVTEQHLFGSAETGDGSVFTYRAAYHQDGGQHTCEADAEFIQNQSAPDEHEQEDIQETVGSREEAELTACPVQFAFEHAFERSHDVVYVVSGHHGESHNEEGRPTCPRLVI